MFSAPIPGQSLTTPPKNAPYERPPQKVKPEDALAFHLDKLSSDKRMDAIMQGLEGGISIQTMTEGLLRAGVANGIHSVDVSIMLAPIIHEYIKSTADAVGIQYDEGDDFKDNDDEMEQIEMGQLRASRKIPEPEIERDDTEEAFFDGPEQPAPVEEVTPAPASTGGIMKRPGGV